MMNRMAFKNYQSMNLVHKTSDGNQLWLGDYYAASNVSLLNQKNIRSVLTSAAMLGISYPKQHAINHKTINAFDVPTYRMTPHFQEAFTFISDALKKGNILVHCAAGISRSTTFVLVYLMKGENMGFNQALNYVRGKRSIICPNYGFQSELKRFQIVLKKSSKNEKEYIPNHSQSYSQKKAVFDFISQQKKTPKKNDKLSSTFGGSKVKSTYTNNYLNNFAGTYNDYGGFLRGKSVNYTQKKSYQLSPDPHKGINKYTKQFGTFKMDAPKIVTIRK